MGSLVVATIVAASIFSDVFIEMAAEISTDVFLDDDAGAIVETVPTPQNAIVDMMPNAAVVRWTVPTR